MMMMMISGVEGNNDVISVMINANGDWCWLWKHNDQVYDDNNDKEN